MVTSNVNADRKPDRRTGRIDDNNYRSVTNGLVDVDVPGLGRLSPCVISAN